MKLDLLSRGRAIAPLVLTALMAAAAAPAAEAVTVFDNIGRSRAGADPIQSYGPLAISFDTGAAAGTLSSVAVLLKSDSSQLVGALQLKLLADDGTSPGAALATLATLSSAAVSTAGFSVYDFGVLSHASLSAHTTYWIEIAANGPAAVEWAWSNDLTGTGVAGQASYSQEFGVLLNSDGGPYQATITVAAVPEPATYVLFAFGLSALVGSSARREAARRVLEDA